MHRLMRPKTLLLIVFLSVLIPITFLLLSLVIQFVVLYWQNAILVGKSVGRVTNFQECESAGFPILEKYPRECRTPQGQSFTEIIDSPTEITITGHQACLPHRDSSGPMTLECALGIQTETGEYYSLDMTDLDLTALTRFSGELLQVSGQLKDPSSNQSLWQKYDIIGIIKVQDLQLVE